jgi:hypothetical protein
MMDINLKLDINLKEEIEVQPAIMDYDNHSVNSASSSLIDFQDEVSSLYGEDFGENIKQDDNGRPRRLRKKPKEMKSDPGKRARLAYLAELNKNKQKVKKEGRKRKTGVIYKQENSSDEQFDIFDVKCNSNKDPDLDLDQIKSESKGRTLRKKRIKKTPEDDKRSFYDEGDEDNEDDDDDNQEEDESSDDDDDDDDDNFDGDDLPGVQKSE